MTGIAIVFLVIAIVIVWGGLTVSTIALTRRPERKTFPPGGGDDDRHDGPIVHDT